MFWYFYPFPLLCPCPYPVFCFLLFYAWVHRFIWQFDFSNDAYCFMTQNACLWFLISFNVSILNNVLLLALRQLYNRVLVYETKSQLKINSISKSGRSNLFLSISIATLGQRIWLGVSTNNSSVLVTDCFGWYQLQS